MQEGMTHRHCNNSQTDQKNEEREYLPAYIEATAHVSVEVLRTLISGIVDRASK